MAGSVLMLVAILALYFLNQKATGVSTFDVLELYKLDSRWDAVLAFGAFALGFCYQGSHVPFHTWLPDAHTEAPTAGSVILAGVLLKMGTYGFIDLPSPSFQRQPSIFCLWVSVLALIGINLWGVVQ